MADGALLENVISDISSKGVKPRLLLHCCCAPCATHVLEYLSGFFLITAYFFNPNIKPEAEYAKRAGELFKLMEIFSYPNISKTIVCDYDAAVFDAAAEPFADEPEGGMRCRLCFELRLNHTAKAAKDGKFDFFATTLSVSPHKNASLINEVGCSKAKLFDVGYLISDFKKKGGFQRTIELSKQYGLYRQRYCGCMYE